MLTALGFCWAPTSAASQNLPDAPGINNVSGLQGSAIGVQTSTMAEVNRLLADRNLAVAEQRCRSFLAANPRSPEVSYLLAYTLYREAKGKESLAAYSAASSLREPEAKDLMVVAADYVLLGDYRSALNWYMHVTDRTPDDATAWYDRARAEFKLEMYTAALADFDKTLALAPGDERAEDNLGLTYEALGDQVKAKAYFEQAVAEEVRTRSGYSLPFLNLGSLLLNTNNLQDALLPLRTAASMSPDNPTARQRLGEVYWKLHEDAAAEHEVVAAVTEAPDVPSLHFLLGRIYHREGKQEDADKEFTVAKTLSEKSIRAEVPNRIAHPQSLRGSMPGSAPVVSSSSSDTP